MGAAAGAQLQLSSSAWLCRGGRQGAWVPSLIPTWNDGHQEPVLMGFAFRKLKSHLEIITINKETLLEDSLTVLREERRAEGHGQVEQDQSLGY
ncbi:Zinc Finger Protein With Krab And Scan Domains 2 [Manis pentadactyla]|nr:Zinc Finger Protein With Krab And Scan Domains 2 [Manis pentadactyla]